MGKIEGTTETLTLKGSKAITNEEARAFTDAIKQLNWELPELTPKQLAIEASQ